MPNRNVLPQSRVALLVIAVLASLASCDGPHPDSAAPDAERTDELFRVGTLVVRESDLERRIREHHDGRRTEATRQMSLDELAKRAQFAQAALDAGLADDPFIRDEVSRLLAIRLRETKLAPRLQEIPAIPEARLRELYESNLERYQAPEKRHVAVLWLNPGPDPERASRYTEKMTTARAFVLQDRDLREHPEKGFSVLGADHSEHQASKFRGGLVGWMQREGGPDAWTKAVADIAFTLKTNGSVSEVITRDEGIFLVRLVDIRPAVTRPFESVAKDLEQAERSRLQREFEEEFARDIESKYPVEWITP